MINNASFLLSSTASATGGIATKIKCSSIATSKLLNSVHAAQSLKTKANTTTTTLTIRSKSHQAANSNAKKTTHTHSSNNKNKNKNTQATSSVSAASASTTKNAFFSTTSTTANLSQSNANANKSLARRLWKSYSDNLHTNPILVKGLSAAIIFFTSDLATQCIFDESFTQHLSDKIRNKSDSSSSSQDEEVDSDVLTSLVELLPPVPDLDFSRAFSGATFGMVASVWLHYWWGLLEKVIEMRLPARRHRLANALTKVAIDQSIGAPLYIYCYYVITNYIQNVKQATSSSASGSLESECSKSSPPYSSEFMDATQKASHLLMPTMMQHWRLWPFVHSFNFYFVPLHHRVLVQNMTLVGWSGYLSHLNNSNPAPHTIKADETSEAEVASKTTTAVLVSEEGIEEPMTYPRLKRRKTVIGIDVVDDVNDTDSRSA